ncbi:BMC domain-containing protein [Cohnella luojiensis]|uniref:BMC domain-containing protein n=1 Tax=Cohnella luojiensis TaxID=652876 RepID=A0A4Y8LQE5_9BACL|nr:BMC domain-containing protein [Cohnella luojiensis]
MIETWGIPALISAADAAAKTADVRVTTYEKVDAGIVTIYLLGDVASVKTAVEAGGEAARRVGKLLATHVIPRPDPSVFEMVSNGSLAKGVRNRHEPGQRLAGNPGNEERVAGSEASPETPGEDDPIAD